MIMRMHKNSQPKIHTPTFAAAPVVAAQPFLFLDQTIKKRNDKNTSSSCNGFYCSMQISVHDSRSIVVQKYAKDTFALVAVHMAW